MGVPYQQYGIGFLESEWPPAFEVFLFACFFLLSVWLLYGLNGLKRFAISGFFLGAFSIFYLLGGVFFPFGSLQAAQAFVPVTVTVVTWILGLLGYATYVTPAQGGSALLVQGTSGSAAFLVYRPSAGVQSQILYSLTILLFLRNATMPFWRRIVYFIVGAVGTFFANVLRIVYIGTLGVNVGTEAARVFHDYYGELFFIFWMIAYLIIVVLIEWRIKRRSQKAPSPLAAP